jgi:molybdenum cofactor cytidylyltransferase
MKFGPVPIKEAEGAILAHSARLPGRVVKKGTPLTADDVAAFVEAGVDEVTALRLDPKDVNEDAAAAEIAAVLGGANVRIDDAFTGRTNLFAEKAGLLTFDRTALDRLNLVDEAVTVATLAPFEPVEKGQMVATVKIIPFAVSRVVLDAALAVAQEAVQGTGKPLLSISPFTPKKIGLILTRLPGMKESILDKTVDTAKARVEAYGSEIVHVERTGHDRGEVVAAIARTQALNCDIILIFGASAVVDRNDVLPSAVVAAGGVVNHFGMPVDPGNLLFIGDLDSKPVVGMPGCARSPKLNGFDWVLWRLLADLEVTKHDIMLMGSGGLLVEIAERGQARASKAKKEKKEKSNGPRVAALILAAGASTRMGSNKLIEDVGGTPMVARVARSIAESKAQPITVVTGNQADKVKQAMDGIAATFVHNPDFAQGLSTSLKAGIAALTPKIESGDIDGIMVCLGDMPLVDARTLDKLIAAFNPLEGRAIVVPVHDGRRGNPVIWSTQYLAEMKSIGGDQGARKLLDLHADDVSEVQIDDEGVLFDVDTPDKLADVRARIRA